MRPLTTPPVPDTEDAIDAALAFWRLPPRPAAAVRPLLRSWARRRRSELGDRLGDPDHNWFSFLDRLGRGRLRGSLLDLSGAAVLANDDGAAPLERAAVLCARAIHFWWAVSHGQLAPEREGFWPLDLRQYRNLFATLVPSSEDERIHHALGPHVVVLLGGRAFALDVVRGGRPCTADEIHAGLRAISALAGPADPEVRWPGVGTTATRDEWAALYQELAADPRNREAAALCRDALLVLALDLDRAPTDVGDAGRLAMVGNPDNRFHDQSVQLVVSGNARAAVVFNFKTEIESAGPRMCAALHGEPARLAVTGGDLAPRVRPVEWRLGAAQRARLERIRTATAAACTRQASASAVFELAGIGAGRLRALGIGVDTAFNLGMQIATARVLGPRCERLRLVEMVSLRRYRDGLVTYVDTTTPAAQALVAALAAGATDAEVTAALRRAAAAHLGLLRDAKELRLVRQRAHFIHYLLLQGPRLRSAATAVTRSRVLRRLLARERARPVALELRLSCLPAHPGVLAAGRFGVAAPPGSIWTHHQIGEDAATLVVITGEPFHGVGPALAAALADALGELLARAAPAAAPQR